MAEISQLTTYAIFTEDTNLTSLPIKFAPPPFGASTGFTPAVTNWTSAFDTLAPGDYTNIVGEGWTTTDTNAVKVVSVPQFASTSNNVLALHSGGIQQTLFDELAGAAWNLRRVRRMEAALCSNISCHDLLEDEKIQKKLDRLARHKTRIERTFHRSLKELKALQTNAVIQAILPVRVLKNVPPLSNAVEISKRTQHFGDGSALQLLEALIESPPPVSAGKAPQAACLSTT